MRCLLIILSFLPMISPAQDSLRIMYYNLLNYPDTSPERADTLRKIVHYAKPDIFVINELQTEAGADLILSQSMNQLGVLSYQRVAFIDGNDTDNMLYYNSDKLGFISQTQVNTTLRDFSEYILYYKSPGLSASSDTVYLNIYSAHLKAGAGEFAQRADEAQILKFHLNTRPDIENVFVGGDFNFYSGNESGCLILRESGSVWLNDPIDQIGNWSGNSSYANIHTQSTRTSSFGGGSGGGMDDRFDLIFVSNDVLDNSNGVSYIPNSYQALGQDGLRYNQSVNSPTNTILPDSVANALYWMSDHLPVILDVVMDYTASTDEFDQFVIFSFDTETRLMRVPQELIGTSFNLYDYTGRLIMGEEITTTSFKIDTTPGVYIFTSEMKSLKIVVP